MNWVSKDAKKYVALNNKQKIKNVILFLWNILKFSNLGFWFSNYNLTTREKEILAHLTEGDSVKLIAKTLFLSEQTVGNHIRHIYEKLQVHSRGVAVAKAFREKIL